MFFQKFFELMKRKSVEDCRIIMIIVVKRRLEAGDVGACLRKTFQYRFTDSVSNFMTARFLNENEKCSDGETEKNVERHEKDWGEEEDREGEERRKRRGKEGNRRIGIGMYLYIRGERK